MKTEQFQDQFVPNFVCFSHSSPVEPMCTPLLVPTIQFPSIRGVFINESRSMAPNLPFTFDVCVCTEAVEIAATSQVWQEIARIVFVHKAIASISVPLG